jgi:uncharacterized SAM-binding protein YcdF (DUF218 family)
MKSKKNSKNIDAILVLGHMIKDKRKLPKILKSRIRKAEQLYKRFNCKVILSGGKRRNINEAYFMKKHINVPKEDILLEPYSRNTKTNAIFCRRIVIKKKFENVIIVTSTYHLFRAFIVFRNVFPWDIKIKMSPAKDPLRFVIKAELFFTEILRLLRDMHDLDFNPKYRKMKNFQ